MSRARKRVKTDAEGESLHPDLRTAGAEARERGRVAPQTTPEQYTEQEDEKDEDEGEEEEELHLPQISRAKPARRRHQGINTLQLLSGATHAAHTLTINSKSKTKSAGTEVGDATHTQPGPRFAPVRASKGGGRGRLRIDFLGPSLWRPNYGNEDKFLNRAPTTTTTTTTTTITHRNQNQNQKTSKQRHSIQPSTQKHPTNPPYPTNNPSSRTASSSKSPSRSTSVETLGLRSRRRGRARVLLTLRGNES
ncbi:hypothetical protein BZA70DRAFT_13663 [Myxozyma melibiosi]|uniref:Uncharacterized protein n=1 Tax=Myxozyma melibiosi TaxID=54550 RepID=A0ABR1FC52_9ASCO